MMELLRELLREAIEEAHQTGLLKDHHDPAETGWIVHGIETCTYRLCVEAREALAATEPPDPMFPDRALVDKIDKEFR